MKNPNLNILLATAWLLSSQAHAGTIGMTGQWDFAGYMRAYDDVGMVTGEVGLVGAFDFDTGMVTLESESPFYGLLWSSSGSLADQGDGTYFADHTAFWGATPFDWDILWEITRTGNTASVVTLDPDGDGIPGTKISDGTLVGLTFEVNGTLTTVPLPAAVWPSGTSLAGLSAAARRKAMSPSPLRGA